MRALFSSHRPGGLWQALLLLLAVALAGQSIAVQSHHHDPLRHCVSAPACKAPAKPQKPDHCALCQEARAAGHYLPVDAPRLALVLVAAFLLAAAAIPAPVRVAPRRRRHSRAPPMLRSNRIALTI